MIVYGFKNITFKIDSKTGILSLTTRTRPFFVLFIRHCQTKYFDLFPSNVLFGTLCSVLEIQ